MKIELTERDVPYTFTTEWHATLTDNDGRVWEEDGWKTPDYTVTRLLKRRKRQLRHERKFHTEANA